MVQSAWVCALVARSPSLDPSLCMKKDTDPPIGLHPGVLCDKTMSPITGFRYTRRGSQPSYDLCQSEFEKLDEDDQLLFEQLQPPLTPRRAIIGAAGLAAASAALALVPTPPEPELFYEDFIELPTLSPAEQLVAFFFKPKVPATEREVAPRSPRRPQLVQPAGAEGCDDACKQRIADRRALYQQSRTTRDRQVILDLSKQRAALYNTTFQGASCIPGIPCL